MTTTLIIGFRATGQAVAEALAGSDGRLVAVEEGATEGVEEAAARYGVELHRYPGLELLSELVAGADLVVPSPGVPMSHPVYRLAAEQRVAVVAEIELAARLSTVRAAGRGPQPRLVAVTGTNGKTTVVTLVERMLNQAGLASVAAGNIGVPLVSVLAPAPGAAPPMERVVAEVSSFQLEYTTTFHPAVAGVLNLGVDHLDWHGTVDNYHAAKARIWANQTSADTLVVNRDDPALTQLLERTPPAARQVGFSLSGTPGTWTVADGSLVDPGGNVVVETAALFRTLPHELANFAAASALASAAGADLASIRDVLLAWRGLAHRMQLVASVDGVSYWDDSKATTPDSVLAAVSGFDRAVLIAGGRNKGLDLSPLAQLVPRLVGVAAIGEAADEVVRAFAGSGIPLVRVQSMAQAVATAAGLARDGGAQAVLLSPACTSWDMYPNYQARGDDFSTLVLAMTDHASGASEGTGTLSKEADQR